MAQKISEDKNFKSKVIPSFRTDNLLLVSRAGYSDYINKLSGVSGIKIDNLDNLKKAVSNRLDFFCEMGCRCADIGIPYFPNRIADEVEADITFKAVLAGKEITDKEYMGFIGNMYLFINSLY